MRGGLIALVAALVLAAGALRSGDPAAAQALWDHARAESPDDLTHPLYIDAAREAGRVRPWQPGFAEARAHLRIIGDARRAVLR